MLGRDDRPMTEEEIIELQNEKQAEQSQEQFAQSMAQHAAGAGPGAAAPPGYWEMVGDADIARDNSDGLSEFTASELSRMHALGNIERSDWRSWGWRTETEFWTMRNEFKSTDTKMGDDDLRIMYGEDRPELDDEKARRLRSTSQVKKLMTSLSVDARGLRSGTEIHAVTKKEEEEPEQSEDMGLVAKAKQKLV